MAEACVGGEMIAVARARWQSILDHPILRLELRRIRRTRWWPGRRFCLIYPVVLGGVLGCGVIVALSVGLEHLPDSARFLEPSELQLAALVTGAPVVCLVSAVTSLLSFALPWIAPAFTSTTIARERELGTLDLLRTTMLSERAIVLGKLGGCLARLWPGILALLLLTPFQLIGMVGVDLFGGYSSILLLAGLGAEQPWLWLLLTGLSGWLKPWGDLALHAALGLFVSALSRTSGAAVAISYGAILAVRGGLWLASSLLIPALMMLAVADPIELMGGSMEYEMLFLGLIPLATVFAEIAGAALLVWGAVWRLKRA
ncbi:MAG: hypothetical protein B6I35_04975 [Anaerolineaceae bacterium 4572_32.2]|nr:MAG: hypothetical protein B6I35_04975 [Anaerolineaceae bacterium 4572_32.2]